MTPPRYRRPRHSLPPDELHRLVAMRTAGSTWKEIGRVFGKQDCACKSIYDKALASGAVPQTARADACAQAGIAT